MCLKYLLKTTSTHELEQKGYCCRWFLMCSIATATLCCALNSMQIFIQSASSNKQTSNKFISHSHLIFVSSKKVQTCFSVCLIYTYLYLCYRNQRCFFKWPIKDNLNCYNIFFKIQILFSLTPTNFATRWISKNWGNVQLNVEQNKSLTNTSMN